jgi:hypothetical protein
MAKQVYWEDVQEGSEITPLSKIASTESLVRWATAGQDFNPLHYEDAYAKMQGQPGVIIHGQLKRAWLVQLMTNWIGEEGTLRKLSCQFRRTDAPRGMMMIGMPKEGETWWCKGKVTKRYTEGEEHRVDCDIWVENGKGERTTPGTAVAVLPSGG